MLKGLTTAAYVDDFRLTIVYDVLTTSPPPNSQTSTDIRNLPVTNTNTNTNTGGQDLQGGDKGSSSKRNAIPATVGGVIGGVVVVSGVAVAVFVITRRKNKNQQQKGNKLPEENNDNNSNSNSNTSLKKNQEKSTKEESRTDISGPRNKYVFPSFSIYISIYLLLPTSDNQLSSIFSPSVLFALITNSSSLILSPSSPSLLLLSYSIIHYS